MILAARRTKAVRVLFADLNGGRRLKQAHIFDHIQQQIRYIIDAIRTIGAEAADVDLGEIGIRPALGSSHSHFGRCRLVIEFDPEAMEKLF